MTDDMLVLADRLDELRETKAKLELSLKEINAEIESVNEHLVAEMVNAEVPRFDRRNKSFYIRTDLHPSVAADRREVLIETLRANGFEDIIQETVHPQTLKAFIKEQVAENNDQIPEWLEGLVSVHQREQVVVRKKS